MPQQPNNNSCCINKDVVVDTNVFLHCDSNTVYKESSDEFLRYLFTTNIKICFDNVFDEDSNRNSSFIGNEYFEKIKPGTISYVRLMDLINKGNTKSISKTSITPIKRKVIRFIKEGENVDRFFLSVTIASTDKTFVSNDFEDFQVDKRKSLEKKFKIFIFCSRDLYI